MTVYPSTTTFMTVYHTSSKTVYPTSDSNLIITTVLAVNNDCLSYYCHPSLESYSLSYLPCKVTAIMTAASPVTVVI